MRSDGGLGRFVRSLVGLDQAAAKQAFAGFLDGKVLTADQLEFIDLIVDHLTARGGSKRGVNRYPTAASTM